jgi:hypothetical protein
VALVAEADLVVVAPAAIGNFIFLEHTTPFFNTFCPALAFILLRKLRKDIGSIGAKLHV